MICFLLTAFRLYSLGRAVADLYALAIKHLEKLNVEDANGAPAPRHPVLRPLRGLHPHWQDAQRALERNPFEEEGDPIQVITAYEKIRRQSSGPKGPVKCVLLKGEDFLSGNHGGRAAPYKGEG